jgi:hypothetical protein
MVATVEEARIDAVRAEAIVFLAADLQSIERVPVEVAAEVLASTEQLLWSL